MGIEDPEAHINAYETEFKPYLDEGDNVFEQLPFQILRDELATEDRFNARTTLPDNLLSTDEAWHAFLFVVYKNWNRSNWKLYKDVGKGNMRSQIVDALGTEVFADQNKRKNLQLLADQVRGRLYEFPNMKDYLSQVFEGGQALYYNPTGERTANIPGERKPSYLQYAKAHEELKKGGKWAGLEVELAERGLSNADTLVLKVAPSKGGTNREYRLKMSSEGLN